MDMFELQNWLQENLLIIQPRVDYIEDIYRYLNIPREFGEYNNVRILTIDDVQKIGNNYVYPTISAKWAEINDIIIRKLDFLDINFLKSIFLETNNQHVLSAIEQNSRNHGARNLIPTFSVPELDPAYYIRRNFILEAIQTKIQNVEANSSKILIIYGMPGIGKTLIVSKFFAQISNQQIKWINIETNEKLTEMINHFSNSNLQNCTLVLDQVRFDFINTAESPFPVVSAIPLIILSNISPGSQHGNKIKISKMSIDEMKILYQSFRLNEQIESLDARLEKLGEILGYHPRSLYEAFNLCKFGLTISEIIKMILLDPKILLLINGIRTLSIYDSFGKIIDNLQSVITKRILPYISYLISNDIPYSVLYSILELATTNNNEGSEFIFEDQKEIFRLEIVKTLKSSCLLEGKPTERKFRVQNILQKVLFIKYLEIKSNILAELGNFIEVRWDQLPTETQNEHHLIIDSLDCGKIL